VFATKNTRNLTSCPYGFILHAQTILRAPLTSLLFVDSGSSLARAAASNTMSGADTLALMLLDEAAKGTKSTFYPYISTINRRKGTASQ